MPAIRRFLAGRSPSPGPGYPFSLHLRTSAGVIRAPLHQGHTWSREHFLAILLDARNGELGVETISVASLPTSIVHPREVFKPAILASASGIIVGHNHPSGDQEPSPEDLSITRRY